MFNYRLLRELAHLLTRLLKSDPCYKVPHSDGRYECRVFETINGQRESWSIIMSGAQVKVYETSTSRASLLYQRDGGDIIVLGSHFDFTSCEQLFAAIQRRRVLDELANV